jgi:hypothetical protein
VGVLHSGCTRVLNLQSFCWLVQGEVARQQQQLLEAQDAQHQVGLKDQEIKARFLKSTLYRYSSNIQQHTATLLHCNVVTVTLQRYCMML